MELLVGSTELKLDSKQRLSLPLSIRKAMGVMSEDEIMLTIGMDGCIAGADLGRWKENFMPRLQRLSWTRAADRDLLREIAPRTFKLRIDTENRVTLPVPLLQWAGLKAGDAVVVQGTFSHFEVWEAGRHANRRLGQSPVEGRVEDRLGSDPQPEADS